MGVRRDGRIVAFQALYAWEETHQELDELLQLDWMDRDIDNKTRLFAGMIVAGTLEKCSDVDNLIREHLRKWSFDRINKVDLAILRTSVYALAYQNDIPPSVTIDEAVEIAKKFGSPDSYRFINGILDGIHKTALRHDAQ